MTDVNAVEGGLTDEQLRQLGRVAVASAILEHSIQFCIWPLLSADQPAARLALAGRTPSETTWLLENLGKLRLSGQMATDVVGLAQEARTAYEARNALLHNRLMPVWSGQDQVVGRVRFPKRGAKTPEVKSDVVTLRQIMGIADRLEAAGQKVAALGSKLLLRHL